MRISIGTRLTAWYGAVVVVALAVGAIAVAQIQSRDRRLRLDEELRRLQKTVVAVLYNEFGEGLDLPGAAKEASMEVIASGHTIVVTGGDGVTLQTWGEPLSGPWSPPATLDGTATVTIDGASYRAITTRVTSGSHPFGIVVLAAVATLDREQAQLTRALSIGVVVALAVAIVGGWIFGRRALRPLSEMAGQAVAISDNDLTRRLQARNPDDELGTLASAFNALLDRLSAALVSQRQFMADASHQLRTPLSIIRTAAQIILGKPERPEHEYREGMTQVSEQSLRLSRLVDAMFLLSRADAGGRSVQLHPLYLDELVGECVRGMTVLAAARNVSIHPEGLTDVPMQGDEHLLRELFGNLLDNAVRHTRADGLVRTVVSATPEAVTIDVIDEGYGVPVESRDRIFERFVHLGATGEGAGLGLPIARWIARAHGGDVTLESSGSSGSQFRVTLSRRLDTAA